MWDGGGSKSTLTKLDDMLGHMSSYLFWPQVDEIEFWHHLKTVIDKLEPICLGTSMNQSESMHLDKVLLKFLGIFLHFQKHSKLGG